MESGAKVKTFVISLKGSDKRRASIKEQMGKFDIKYEIVDAVNGYELDISHDDRIDHKALAEFPYWLTPGAIGCALSHLDCYRKAIAEDLDYLIIIEDDARIVEDYTSYLHKIFNNIKDKEVVLLYYTAFALVTLDAKSSVPLDAYAAMYHLKDGWPITTTAYILPREAYRSMAAGILPIRVTIDKWEYFVKEKMLSDIVCVYPNPVDTMDFKSDIDYHDAGWKQELSELIDRKRIFPFYQILREMRRRTKLKMKQTRIA